MSFGWSKLHDVTIRFVLHFTGLLNTVADFEMAVLVLNPVL